MNSIDYQLLINDTLKNKEATYEISAQQRALILSVDENSDLIVHLDNLWKNHQKNLAPLNGQNPILMPDIKIGAYRVNPTYRRKIIKDGCHLYNFGYVPKVKDIKKQA